MRNPTFTTAFEAGNISTVVVLSSGGFSDTFLLIISSSCSVYTQNNVTSIFLDFGFRLWGRIWGYVILRRCFQSPSLTPGSVLAMYWSLAVDTKQWRGEYFLDRGGNSAAPARGCPARGRGGDAGPFLGGDAGRGD